MYCINLTTTQAVELNELLQWYISSGHKAFSGKVIGEIQEQIDYQLWDTMDDDELWDIYVHTVGADALLQDYRHFVSRTQMIQELTGRG